MWTQTTARNSPKICLALDMCHVSPKRKILLHTFAKQFWRELPWTLKNDPTWSSCFLNRFQTTWYTTYFPSSIYKYRGIPHLPEQGKEKNTAGFEISWKLRRLLRRASQKVRTYHKEWQLKNSGTIHVDIYTCVCVCENLLLCIRFRLNLLVGSWNIHETFNLSHKVKVWRLQLPEKRSFLRLRVNIDLKSLKMAPGIPIQCKTNPPGRRRHFFPPQAWLLWPPQGIGGEGLVNGWFIMLVTVVPTNSQ